MAHVILRKIIIYLIYGKFKMFKYLYDLFMSFIAYLMELCGGNKIESGPETEELKEQKEQKEHKEQEEVR